MKTKILAALGVSSLLLSLPAFAQRIPTPADLLGGYTGPSAPPWERTREEQEVYENMMELYRHRLEIWKAGHPGEWQAYVEKRAREKKEREKQYRELEQKEFLSSSRNQGRKLEGVSFDQVLYSYVTAAAQEKGLGYVETLTLPHIVRSPKFPGLIDLLLQLRHDEGVARILALSPAAREWPDFSAWVELVLAASAGSSNSSARSIAPLLSGKSSKEAKISARESARLRNHPDAIKWMKLMLSDYHFTRYDLRDFLDWSNGALIKRFLPTIVEFGLRNAGSFDTIVESLFASIPENPYLVGEGEEAALQYAARKVFGELEVPAGLKRDESAIARTLYLRILASESPTLAAYFTAAQEKALSASIGASRKVLGQKWFRDRFFDRLTDRRARLLVHFAADRATARELLSRIHDGTTRIRTLDGYFGTFNEWIPDVSIELYRKAGATVQDKKLLAEIFREMLKNLRRKGAAGFRQEALAILLEKKFYTTDVHVESFEPGFELMLDFYEKRLYQGLSADAICNQIQQTQSKR